MFKFIHDMKQRIKLLEIENDSLRKKIKSTTFIVDPGFDDPIPRNTEERMAYVDRYAVFHDEFLDKKLKHLIAQVREQLDSFGWEGLPYDQLPSGMTRAERDAFLRGTSNAFRLLLEYGEQMRGEQMANIINNSE